MIDSQNDSTPEPMMDVAEWFAGVAEKARQEDAQEIADMHLADIRRKERREQRRDRIGLWTLIVSVLALVATVVLHFLFQ